VRHLHDDGVIVAVLGMVGACHGFVLLVEREDTEGEDETAWSPLDRAAKDPEHSLI